MSTEDLVDGLDRTEQAVNELGYRVDEMLEPGLAADAVRSLLAETDLVATDDVVAWFGFGDGRRAGASVEGLFDNSDVLSLADAIQYRAVLIGEGHNLDRALPLSRGKPTVVVSLDTGEVREFWWDEPPRSTDDSLVQWVERQLTTLSDRGLWERSEWTPCFDLSFPVGTIELDDGGRSELDVVLARIEEIGASRIRIHCVANGKVPGNNNLESQQVEVVRQLLIAAGIAAPSIEVDMVESRSDHVHAMRFSGR